jgi:hypothetical protein
MAIIYGNGFIPLNGLAAAYNPIIVSCEDDGATGTPPVVYCDVYLDDVFWKTISNSSPLSTVGLTTLWRFDISGVVQEYMKTVIPIPETPVSLADPIMEDLYLAPPAYLPYKHGGAARCWVRFRNSTLTAGILTPQSPEPVQATIDSAAIPGTGYQIDVFFVINAAMQLNTDELSSFEFHLKQNRFVGTIPAVPWSWNVNPNNKVYPLTHMKRGKIYAEENGQLPVVCMRDGFFNYPGFMSNIIFAGLALIMYDKNGTMLYGNVSPGFTIPGEAIYNIPVGLKNVSLIFPSFNAFIKDTEYYVLFLYDQGWATFVPGSGVATFRTPKYYLQQAKNEYPTRRVRIWFKNHLGHFDAVSFKVADETIKASGTLTERRYSINNLPRTTATRGRNNVKAGKYSQVSDVFAEDEMRLIEELVASSEAYMDATFSPVYPKYPGGARSLVPIVMDDIEVATLKYDDRYEYEVTVKYSMSHEAIIVRG